MGKRPPNYQWIKELFAEVEEEFEGKSTEFYFQMTCDRYQMRYGQEIDHGDVANALSPEG